MYKDYGTEKIINAHSFLYQVRFV